jgi:2-oxoglutarate ferredoxin oxidoreductase subunit alpha
MLILYDMNKSKLINSLTWVIGGAQGSGVDSAANIFSRACAQNGWYVYGKREYYSNIKGEHSYFTVRISDSQIHSHTDDIDILASFDADTIFRHAGNVTKNGVIIYDSDLIDVSIQEVQTIDDLAAKRISILLEKSGNVLTIQGMLDYAKDKEILLCGIPYLSILQEFSEKLKDPSLSKLTRMTNVMALSSSIAILNLDIDILYNSINHVFRTKPRIADLNNTIAREIYNYTKEKFDTSTFRSKIPYTNKHPLSDLILIQGIQSSAIGKLVAGCRFQTYYPITPASDESEFLESNEIIEQTDEKRGSIVVVQTEDEISAIAMAIGAALAGTRSSTATSGPGFSLMAEALGWAGMNEVPVVITLYQRAGPSTGLPTRHEQGDLQFVIHAGHGEFPRIVLASGDIEESFHDAIKVFNFAEKYQVPVIHMLDKAIANSVMTCKVFDKSKPKIERGIIVNEVAAVSVKGRADDDNKTNNYLRFKLSNNPLSPRAVLGTKDTIFWNAGDEHTEDGHISEDPENRISMMDKRMNKLDIALREIPDEDKAIFYGADNNYTDNEITIVSWGSTKGAILDAIERLSVEGRNNNRKIGIKFVQIRLIHPFPSDLLKRMLDKTKVLVDVEMNFSSQLGLLIEQNLHRNIDYRIVKYNGRPMSCSEIYDAISCIIDEKAPRRIVLRHGD